MEAIETKEEIVAPLGVPSNRFDELSSKYLVEGTVNDILKGIRDAEDASLDEKLVLASEVGGRVAKIIFDSNLDKAIGDILSGNGHVSPQG